MKAGTERSEACAQQEGHVARDEVREVGRSQVTEGQVDLAAEFRCALR